MDWATGDYTKTYADTIYVPEQEHGAGVYLLDEGGRGGGPGRACPARARPARARERYYTGGNVVADRAGGVSRRVFGAAWDERPQHYSPSSGPEWAHLVPDPRARPPGGGPAPSLAYPLITHSEAAVDPARNPFPSAPSKECYAAGGGAASAELTLQLVKVVLLVVIVVLLAMTLAASNQVARSLEKTVREAVGALGAASSAR